MPIKVMLLRYHFPDGHSKDWAYPTPVMADAPNFTVYFGRTGSPLRRRDTPASACRNGSVLAEAPQRIREKRVKGYRELGEYWLDDNGQDLRPVTALPAGPEPVIPSTPTPPATGPALYWRLRIQDQADQAALENVGQTVARQLETVGWRITNPGAGESVLHGFWTPLVSGTPHGRVELLPGHEPVVAFLLLVARRFTGLRVAHEDQQILTDWPQELPVSDQILETLGLKPVSTERLLAAMVPAAFGASSPVAGLDTPKMRRAIPSIASAASGSTRFVNAR